MDRYNEALEKMKPVDLSKVSNDDKLVRSTYICTMVCVVWRNSSSSTTSWDARVVTGGAACYQQYVVVHM